MEMGGGEKVGKFPSLSKEFAIGCISKKFEKCVNSYSKEYVR